MLQVIRRNLKNGINKCQGPKGQVAFILILLTAAALIFYAVTLNLSKVANNKTATTIASNTAASLMASQMASYTQSIVMEYLKGKLEYCENTGLLGAIVMLIISVIIMIIVPAAGWYLVLAILAVTLSVVSLAIQVCVVQPGITSMWNKMISETMGITDQFLEGGVNTALQSAVADSENVPDLYDYDNDTVWGWAADGMPKDGVGRYSYYYTQRLKKVIIPDYTPVADFLDALDDFVHKVKADGSGDSTWGLYDPLFCTVASTHQCCSSNRPSECNRCCAPADLRPSCCDIAAADGGCGYTADCAISTYAPYLNDEANEFNEYKLIYDPIVEDDTNTFISFMEKLGKDDGTPIYYKTGPSDIPQIYDLTQPFKLDDATGVFHQNLHKLKSWGTDLTTAMSIPLPETNYWSLSGCPDPSLPAELQNPCLDFNYPSIGDALLSANFSTNAFVDSITDNVLNRPPLAADKFAVNNSARIFADDNACAEQALPAAYDYYNPNFIEPTYMSASGSGFWKDGSDFYCNTGDDTANPLWPYNSSCPREGTSSCTEAITRWHDDATGLPLATPIVEIFPIMCPCDIANGTDPTLWFDDILDNWRYGLTEFISWAEKMLDNYKTDSSFMQKNYQSWYDEAAKYLEPRVELYDVTGNSIGPNNDVWDYYSIDKDKCLATNPSTGGYIGSGTVWPSGPCCNNCGDFYYDASGVRHLEPSNAPYNGILQKFIEEISYVRRKLIRLKTEHFEGAACYRPTAVAQTEVWCVPPESVGAMVCPVKNRHEAATFDSNSNGVIGDLEDIVACLNWNANNTDGLGPVPAQFASVPPVYKGNWAKFYECHTQCGAANCSNLPRSLVPGFDSAVFVAPNAEHTVLRNCLRSTTAAQCQAACAPLSFPPGALRTTLTPLWTPAGSINPTTMNTVCAAWTGGPTNAFRTAILNQYNFYNTFPWPLNAIQTSEKAAIGAPGDGATDTCLGATTVVDCVAQCTPCVNCAAGNTGIPVINANSPIFTTVYTPGSCDWVGAKTPTLNAYYNVLISVAPAAGGSCSDATYLTNIQKSMYEAMVQGRKFEQRRAYLQNRLDQLNQMIDALTLAENKFIEFYNGPVQDFIKYRMSQRVEKSGLPPQAIYGWQTTPDVPDEIGAWHIVKVDARTPGRCDSCNPAQTGPQPFPSIKTKVKNWGTTRCFYLINYEGVVKVRVTRFDEDKSGAGKLLFPNGVPIWDFRSIHPLRGSVTTVGLNEACANVIELNPTAPYTTPPPYFNTLHPQLYISSEGTYRIYGGGFIMNEYIPEIDPVTSLDNPYQNADCWKRSTELLGFGVTTETCAQYYWGGAGRMQVKFIPCKTW